MVKVVSCYFLFYLKKTLDSFYFYKDFHANEICIIFQKKLGNIVLLENENTEKGHKNVFYLKKDNIK